MYIFIAFAFVLNPICIDRFKFYFYNMYSLFCPTYPNSIYDNMI